MLKKEIAKFIIKKRVAKDKKSKIARVFKYNDVKSILIIMNALNIDDIEKVRMFASKLETEGKEVSVLGYYETKEPPKVTLASNIHFYGINDFTLTGKPKPTFLKGSIKKSVDLLINFDMHSAIMANYVAALSRADFKVSSLSSEVENVGDMLLDISKMTSLDDYFEQVIFYLEMINKSVEEE